MYWFEPNREFLESGKTPPPNEKSPLRGFFLTEFMMAMCPGEDLNLHEIAPTST